MFWLDNLPDLFRSTTPGMPPSLFPSEGTPRDEQYNSLTRLVLLISLGMYLSKHKYTIHFLLFGIILIIISYYKTPMTSSSSSPNTSSCSMNTSSHLNSSYSPLQVTRLFASSNETRMLNTSNVTSLNQDSFYRPGPYDIEAWSSENISNLPNVPSIPPSIYSTYRDAPGSITYYNNVLDRKIGVAEDGRPFYINDYSGPQGPNRIRERGVNKQIDDEVYAYNLIHEVGFNEILERNVDPRFIQYS